MPPEPTVRYDEESRTIIVEPGGETAELYADASRREFEFFRDVEQFEFAAATLVEDLHKTMSNQQVLIQQNEYFSRLDDLQRQTGNYYSRCLDLKEESDGEDSEIISAQKERLYKTEKLLKHFFRCLAGAQSLGFSQRLILLYQLTGDYVFLYGFVRNTCSTLEFLGTLIENRLGDGDIELGDSGTNFVDVYEELDVQGLHEVLNDDQQIQIPPTGESKRMGEIALSVESIDYLRRKRNTIVHHCPLVVSAENLDHLPPEICSTSILTSTDIKRLTNISYRLHYHSLGMFGNLTLSYWEEMAGALVGAWYSGSDPRAAESDV